MFQAHTGTAYPAQDHIGHNYAKALLDEIHELGLPVFLARCAVETNESFAAHDLLNKIDAKIDELVDLVAA
jgi:hypothetical protein